MDSLADVFTKIKPFFDAIVKNPNTKDVISLNGLLKQVDEPSMQIVQKLLLPQLVILVDIVSGENRNELKTHLLECIATVLRKAVLTNTNALRTTLMVTIKQVYDAGNIRRNLSEEYKLAALQVISLATRRIQSELIEELYVRNNLQLLSGALLLCVTIVRTERYRKLRFQALDAILSVMQLHDDSDFDDIVIRHHVAEVLFIVLPKMITTFVGALNGDDKQGTALYQIAIKALGRTLNLIFHDYAKAADTNAMQITADQFRKLIEETKDRNEPKSVLGLGTHTEQEKLKYFHETARTREWMLAADDLLEKALRKILHLRGHEEEPVRLEFAKMNVDLLRNCTYNMPSCTVHYLETVIAMSHDESDRIRRVCQGARKSVTNTSISIEGNRMDELFFAALNKMPRTIYRGEEREQIAAFQLVTGYLNFFSESQLADIFSCTNILEQFIVNLLAAAELDAGAELIRREYVSYRFEYEEGFRLQKEKRESRWIVLKNVQSDRSKRAFLELLRALHRHEQPLSTVLLYILDDFFSTRMNSNAYLFILYELIPGKATDDQHRLLDTFKNMLSEMLQPHHWLLELDENDNIIDQKYNALHVCLVLRIISRMALFMGEHFRWYLYDALRAILQCSGCTLNCVNESAEMALDTVAVAQGMPTIQALLHDNLDYISQHVTRCLRRPEQLRDGLCVLESVLRFVPYESSDVLESTVTPIVMNILDSYSQYGERNSIVCLRVLQIFIHSIRLRYQKDSELPSEVEEEQKEATGLAEQIKRLQALLEREVTNGAEMTEELDFETISKDDDNAGGMEEQNTQHDGMEEEPQAEEIIPAHIKIVLRILSVNYKYLASSHDAERIIALSTINEGIYVLHRHENQLLPLVHNVWYNLTERFADRNPAVVGNAFDLLVTLARLSRDFIRQRSLADVFPKIYKFMTDNYDADASAHQVFKMQCKFLASIADLVRDLRMGEKQLDQALEVVRLYLERSKRPEIKKRAADCLKQMRKLDPTAVFLKCGCSLKYLQ